MCGFSAGELFNETILSNVKWYIDKLEAEYRKDHRWKYDHEYAYISHINNPPPTEPGFQYSGLSSAFWKDLYSLDSPSPLPIMVGKMSTR